MHKTECDERKVFAMIENNNHLVGIISDTHDNRKAIAKAVTFFNDSKCSLVVHAGDYIAPFTAKDFEKLTCPLIGVFGNNDGEKKGLIAQFSSFGELHEGPYEFDYSGKRFILMHEPDSLDYYRKQDSSDIIIYGHTHKVDIHEGKPLIINPGECCAWLTDHATVVLLDLSTFHIEVVELNL